MDALCLVLHGHGIQRSMWRVSFLASRVMFDEYSSRTASPSNGLNWTSTKTKADS